MTDTKSNGSPFIPAALDDYGLPSTAFRVFCRLARRGDCWESIPSMARGCGLHRQTIRSSIKLLIKQRMIRRTDQPGRPSVFECLPAEQWQPPLAADPYETDTRVSKATGSKGIPTPLRNEYPPPYEKEVGDPYETDTHEGTPTKVLPLRDPNKVPPAILSILIPDALDTPTFREAWAAWVEYRLSYKTKTKRPELMFAAQLKDLAKQPDTAVEVLQQSIKNGWQGLFPQKPGSQANNRRGQPI